jgi:enamine deaminase RidA (YjgF/YER057c/UK114 family)
MTGKRRRVVCRNSSSSIGSLSRAEWKSEFMRDPKRFSDAQHPYSPLRTAGDLVFVSGQLGVADNEIVAGGIVAETQQAFANLVDALGSVGLARVTHSRVAP